MKKLIFLIFFLVLFSSSAKVVLAAGEYCKAQEGYCTGFLPPCPSGQTDLGKLDCPSLGSSDEYGNVQYGTCCKIGKSGCKVDNEQCSEGKECCSGKCEYDQHFGANRCTAQPIPTITSLPLSSQQQESIDFNIIAGWLPKLNKAFRPDGAANVAGIINLVLPYVFIIAGLILLFFLIAGGFQLMTSPGDEKAVASAKAKIGNALIGFLLLFVSYWIVQIIQTILGFQVL